MVGSDVGCVELAYNMDRWRSLVNAVTKLHVP